MEEGGRKDDGIESGVRREGSRNVGREWSV